MGQFVGQRVQELAEFRDHVEFPGNHTVKHIGDGGNAHDHGSPVIVCVRHSVEIQPYKYRNHDKAEISHQVRN